MLREARIITSRAQLETVFRHIAKLAYPYVVEWRDVRRTDEQNRMMWPILKAFAEQAELSGRKLTDHQWKSVFLQALGHPQDMLPTLDGSTWFSAGLRSSRLTKQEFSQLIDLMQAEAAQRGVKIDDETA